MEEPNRVSESHPNEWPTGESACSTPSGGSRTSMKRIARRLPVVRVRLETTNYAYSAWRLLPGSAPPKSIL